jgi:DNA-binding transcriptional LysR family regulator
MLQLDGRYVDEINALLAVAETKSFAAARRLLERDPSVISKRVSALERRLGVRLLERTTRQVALTDIGSALVDRLREGRTILTEAIEEASSDAKQLRGRLRLAFPAAMGRLWLSDRLSDFLAMHPLLSLEIDYHESYVDLVAEGFDVAIRIGTLADSRLVAKKLASHRRVLCAAPKYVQRFGAPREPSDLAGHNCLGFTQLRSYPNLRLSRKGRSETIAISGSIVSNDSEALLVTAKAGIGILCAGDWLASRDLAAGTLVRILPDWEVDREGGVYLVRASAILATARTKAFVDFMSKKFSLGTPWAAVGHCR